MIFEPSLNDFLTKSVDGVAQVTYFSKFMHYFLGVFLAALAPPSPPKLVMTPATAIHHKDDQDYLHRMQKRLEEKISENITYHGLNEISKSRNSSASEDNPELEVDTVNMDFELLMGNKDTCVLEVIWTSVI